MSRYLHPGMYFNLPLFHYLPSEALQNESYSQKFDSTDSNFVRVQYHLTLTASSWNPRKPKSPWDRFLNIRLENVTSLNCSALYIDECLELLRLAPKVTDFVVGVIEGNDNYTIPSVPLIHSQLRKLSIMHNREITMDSLFSKITLPSLESFSYKISSSLTIQSNTLIELLVRSHPPLRHLSLDKILMNARNFINLMKLVPQLEELEILFEDKTTCFDYFLVELGTNFSKCYYKYTIVNSKHAQVNCAFKTFGSNEAEQPICVVFHEKGSSNFILPISTGSSFLSYFHDLNSHSHILSQALFF